VNNSILDKTDRLIINSLQGGFPICDSPFRQIARQLDIDENDLIQRLENLLADKTLSRFGPMYDIQKLGGSFSLCAIQVPAERFDEVTDIVNAFDEVAHNYERDHEFNMWYVLATETQDMIKIINRQIENITGLRVYNMPKLEEYFVGLRFEA
jgi:DNA-binding Lrp family transcriptional regulator